MKPFRIAVDFDGTIVDHRFPEIGKVVPGALEWLQKWSRDPDVCLMLWTMRSDGRGDGDLLRAAADWCGERGVFFQYRNVAPQAWTESPKLYANTYIDDAAAGVPLVERAGFARPSVDWFKVGPLVDAMIEKHKSHYGSAA